MWIESCSSFECLPTALRLKTRLLKVGLQDSVSSGHHLSHVIFLSHTLSPWNLPPFFFSYLGTFCICCSWHLLVISSLHIFLRFFCICKQIWICILFLSTPLKCYEWAHAIHMILLRRFWHALYLPVPTQPLPSFIPLNSISLYGKTAIYPVPYQ